MVPVRIAIMILAGLMSTMYDTDHMSCCQCVGDLDAYGSGLAGTQPPVMDQTVESLAAPYSMR